MGFPRGQTKLFEGLGFSSTFQEHSITDKLLAHFPMDDGSNEIRSSAAIGRVQLAQFNNVPRVSGVSIYTNFAADFNGNNHYLSDQFAYPEFAPASGGLVGNITEHKVPNEFTMAGWVYLKSTSPRYPTNIEDIITKWGNNTSGGRGWLLQYVHSGHSRAEGFTFAFSTDGDNFVSVDYGNGSGVALDAWHHVRASVDSDYAYLQVNNGPVQKLAIGGSGIINKDDPLEFARLNVPNPPSTRYAGISLDSWSFWGRVITEAENATIYNNGSGLGFPWAPVHDLADGIQACWPLNEGGGSAYDVTGRKRNLSANGSPTIGVGVVGSGRAFNSSLSQWLEASNPSWGSIGARDWTLGFRFRPDPGAAQSIVVAKNNETGVGGAGSEWNVQYNPAVGNTPASVNWRVLYNDAPFEGGVGAASGTTNGPLDDGDFHSVMVGHINGSGDWVQVDGGEFIGQDELTGGQNDGNADFTIGRRDHATPLFFDGVVSDVTIWHKFPTAQEREFYLTGSSPLPAFPFGSGTPYPGEVIGSGIPLDDISDGNPYIEVSGLPTFADEYRWPYGSGRDIDGNVGFSRDLDARLSDLTAQFGFNQQPHRFTMTWVPVCFNFEGTELPDIGEEVDFNVGSFRIRGRIVHADKTKSAQGLKVTTTVEDYRTDLNRLVLDTYGLYDEEEEPEANIIDVHHWFLKNQGGLANPRDLRMLREHGATYKQIYNAILEANSSVATQLPSPGVLSENLGDLSTYRFSFRTTPLLDAITKILSDAAFDMYYHMGSNTLNVVNRQKQIDIDINDVPFKEDDPNNPTTISLKLGHDEPERPTAVQVLGDRMEGVISNGGKLGTTDGVYGGRCGLGLPGGAEWKPAWRGATIYYFGEDGTIQQDKPTDGELAAALKGIEFWAEKKSGSQTEHIDSRLSEQGIDPISGRQVPVVSPVSASGAGLIQNRGQDGRSWIIEWYNRVRNFAQNHYTRTYSLTGASALYGELDRFDVVDEAWCGLENQSGGGFNQGYSIQGDYRWLAPFWNHDENKMRAWAVIDKQPTTGGSKSPLWGQDGKGVPTQFAQWNEDESYVFVPIEVKKWNRAASKFSSDWILKCEQSANGMYIRFPNMMWRSFEENEALVKLPKVRYMRAKFTTETSNDSTIDPATEGRFYEEFRSGINIPVKMYKRYGNTCPSKWSAGYGLDGGNISRMRAEVIQRDDLAPWNFEPHDDKDSLDLMDSEGKAVARGRVVNRSQSTFIEATKVGLPTITFDGYSDPTGEVKHGITNISVTKNASSYWQTRYSAKTHFPQPVKAKPVPNEVMEDFRFALHRFNEKFNRPPKPQPFQPPTIFDPKTEDDFSEFITKPSKESFKVPVIIEQIFNVTTSVGDPDVAYAGEDGKNILWPVTARAGIGQSLSPTSKLGANQYAFCIDGFLQRGMQATYNYEDQDDGSFVHYFTGGVQLREARMVVCQDSPFQDEEGDWRINVQVAADTLQIQVPNSDPVEYREVTLEPIEVYNVIFSDQNNVDQTLQRGDKVLMSGAGQENGNVVKPRFTGTQYIIDMSIPPQKDKIFILTSGRAGAGALFATVLTKPNATTGRDSKIQTVSQLGGTNFTDGLIVGAGENNPGTRYYNDFVGVEYGHVAIGDPCIVVQEAEDTSELGEGEPRVIRNICFVLKPLFMSTDAFGSTVT
jgi:hypothetical protein